MFLSPAKGERLGEGASKTVRVPLTQPLPLAGEMSMSEIERGSAPRLLTQDLHASKSFGFRDRFQGTPGTGRA